MDLGNIARENGDLQLAKAKYEAGLESQLSLSPNHVVAAALFYKLGKIKIKQGDYASALYVLYIINSSQSLELNHYRSDLKNAMHIAKQRQSEGDVARISYQLAILREARKDSSDLMEAGRLRAIAYSLKEKIERGSGSYTVLGSASESEDDCDTRASENDEASFDRLVSFFYR
jgi:hypothetical protein